MPRFLTVLLLCQKRCLNTSLHTHTEKFSCTPLITSSLHIPLPAVSRMAFFFSFPFKLPLRKIPAPLNLDSGYYTVEGKKSHMRTRNLHESEAHMSLTAYWTTKDHSMESNVEKKNLIITQWRFHSGRLNMYPAYVGKWQKSWKKKHAAGIYHLSHIMQEFLKKLQEFLIYPREKYGHVSYIVLSTYKQTGI